MKLLALLLLALPALSQPVTTKSKFNLDAIPAAKRIECQQQGGCFVLTRSEMMGALKAANNAGRRAAAKEQK